MITDEELLKIQSLVKQVSEQEKEIERLKAERKELMEGISSHIKDVMSGPFYGETKNEYATGRFHAIDCELDFLQFLLNKFNDSKT